MKRSTRWLIGGVASLLFLAFHAMMGRLQIDHWAMVAAGLTAWLATGRLRPFTHFIVPLVIMCAVYDAQRYWVEALRAPVRVIAPHAWEIAWFGVHTPTGVVTPARWFQTHTLPWLDAIAGAAYLTFIPAFFAMAAWWRFRQRRVVAQDVMWAMLILNLAAYVTFLAFPAAPPWYVDHYGFGPAVLSAPAEAAGAVRFDALFHVSWFAEFYGRNANVFGAFPSLHVGQSFLAMWYAWRFRSLRVTATTYWLITTWGSVYLNHHYLVDGIVGIVYALMAAGAMAWWRSRRPVAPASPTPVVL